MQLVLPGEDKMWKCQLNVWLKQDVTCVIEKENKEYFAKISSDMVVVLKHTGGFPDTSVQGC